MLHLIAMVSSFRVGKNGKSWRAVPRRPGWPRGGEEGITQDGEKNDDKMSAGWVVLENPRTKHHGQPEDGPRNLKLRLLDRAGLPFTWK